jgi:hypothetical protein
MPSYLDFNSTSSFRDFILGRTLQQPNGPQTFTSANYTVQNLSNLPNVDPGDVVTGSGLPIQGSRALELLQTQSINTFKPLQYFVKDTLDTLPRRANLVLYSDDGGNPYFTYETHNLVGIMSTGNYDSESELFKFAASYIRDKNKKGPVYARIEQNLYTATLGKVRLLDALNGNTSTAINLLTGREPLVESNNKITVNKTLAGKAIDFLETVAGVTAPFSEIPGDYLSNPANPINYRPQAKTEGGKLLQDITGALGSLIGIQRRPKLDRKPSDLFIEYMGEGQKKTLFDLLSYSKYAPNYTTTARSQNSSKIFNFVDKLAQGVKSFLGVEAPTTTAYIGDDRGNDVKYAMNDFNDRPVRGNYYLTLMFDQTQAQLFQRTKNIGEGGQISNKLTWISKHSKNKIGENNKNFNQQRSQFEESLSDNFTFREDSILGLTQEILDTMPTNGGEARSHVGNVIDQTTRMFREGDVKMSKGSAIKYVDKFSGDESGVEYCRVWTKDRPYYTMSDTMKKSTEKNAKLRSTGNPTGTNYRRFGDSVMTTPYNLNIAPMGNGGKGDDAFSNSSNIFNNYQYGGGFYAKKYMFSIENLAWKTSTLEGFTVQDLPYCERGPNGGRVMWFPPYDLKVTETNNAKWEETSFLGRPEPLFTYQNTTRSGTIGFKVVVDHPSILNLLVRDYFANMSDEESDNYINAFFAGCIDFDLYDLVKRFTTLDGNDVDLIHRYLNAGTGSETINKYKSVTDPIKTPVPDSGPVNPNSNSSDGTTEANNLSVNLKFENDVPKKGYENYMSSINYDKAYNDFKGKYTTTKTQLSTDVTNLLNYYVSHKGDKKAQGDNEKVLGTPNPDTTDIPALVNKATGNLQTGYDKLDSEYDTYKKAIQQLKLDISGGTIQDLTIDVSSSTSILAGQISNYNMNLSFRRSYSVILDILQNIAVNEKDIDENFRKNKLKWDFPKNANGEIKDPGNGPYPAFDTPEITFKDLGYNDKEGKIKFHVTNYGQKGTVAEQGGGNVGCDRKKFEKETDLDVVAPISFLCRQATVKFNYAPNKKQPTEDKPKTTTPDPEKELPKTRIIEDGTITIPSKIKKPPIDVMKRIIMKTLSECHYFKKLEEDSPVAFSSLKEKLKYFHPGFHSTTPEGLNKRLTFLHQCLRPGDTLPIKGLSDEADLNARNTTFGPPPICVLRVGDFYHSKIVIRDVNITFDENVWDLNPEGIGVQPMIATVQLQINFIGGQGLSRPVERLQNALSSNFYANTEMYDERSIPTNKTIDGIDAEKYTKTFLEELLNTAQPTPTKSNDVNDKVDVVKGKFIGELNGKSLSYDKLVDNIFEKTKNYFEKYKTTYNSVVTKFGPDIASLFFLPKYRTIYQYDVTKAPNNAQSTTIDLLGNFPKGKEISLYVRSLKDKVLGDISGIQSLSKDLLDIKINQVKFNKSDGYLKPYFDKEISNTIDQITSFTGIKDLEDARNELVSALDNVNFIVNYEHDGKIEGETPTKVDISGFTANVLYKEYSKCIEYITDNHSRLIDKIDRTIDFNNMSSLTVDQSIQMVSILLKDKKEDILKLYESDTTTFKTDVEVPKIKKALENFLETPSEVKFKIKKYPTNDKKKLTFDTGATADITDATEKDSLKKIMSKKVEVTSKLNFYKP